MCMFCRSFFVLLYFFFWPVLSVLRYTVLITPLLKALVSSNFSRHIRRRRNDCTVRGQQSFHTIIFNSIQFNSIQIQSFSLFGVDTILLLLNTSYNELLKSTLQYYNARPLMYYWWNYQNSKVQISERWLISGS